MIHDRLLSSFLRLSREEIDFPLRLIPFWREISDSLNGVFDSRKHDYSIVVRCCYYCKGFLKGAVMNNSSKQAFENIATKAYFLHCLLLAST